MFLLGSLVLGVGVAGVAGVAGALSTSRGWMSLVREAFVICERPPELNSATF